MMKFGHVARLQSPGICRACTDLLAPLSIPAHTGSCPLGSITDFFSLHDTGLCVAELSDMFCKDALKQQFPFSF